MAATGSIGWFADLTLADRPSVGGKGGSLGELTRAGIAVPEGFVVRTAAFEEFIAVLERERPVRAAVAALAAEDLDGITALSAQLSARLQAAPLPAAPRAELAAAHGRLCAGDARAPLAVRSSATTEDAADASFAGLQDTYLWVMGAGDVERQVRACWASLYSVPSMAYRRRNGLPENEVAMAVVVQKMVHARSAGVMFTRSPTSGDRSVIVIEGAWGLGSAVVGGEVTPDRFVLGKLTGEISVREIRDKHVRHVPRPGGGVAEEATPPPLREMPCVSDEELQQLREVARRIEKHYGRPQDIEWAIDGGGALRILQSRPETVWSMKEAAPVAAAKDNPLHHVMSVFGGRH
ncbi:MAG TPA: PEP/pyruvate-binding domain-containing protein [Steroidobacteraceae bacterium]|nr:PEP/pyruvate-binding domain-containing protein [Steroidobacteraceae bacterium]